LTRRPHAKNFFNSSFSAAVKWSHNTETTTTAPGSFGVGFWRPVSASKNSVPGGRARARTPAAFVAALAIFEPT
jgi:hypothetical protein